MIVYSLWTLLSTAFEGLTFCLLWRAGIRKFKNRFAAFGSAILGWIGVSFFLQWLSGLHPHIHSSLLWGVLEFTEATSLTFMHVGYIRLSIMGFLTVFVGADSGLNPRQIVGRDNHAEE